MTEELCALAADGMMGRVLWDRSRDRLAFRYDDDWRNNDASFPLSLSMPLTAAEHGHKAVEPFLWGLLPDNDGVLKRWGERFQVSPRHPFQLLSHVGEECAGAVQLVPPERAARRLKSSDTGLVKWMKDDEIAERVALLLKDHSVSRIGGDEGQFSLAGAQPKTGFHYDPRRNRWGIPSGVIPTTHIFKPAAGHYDGYAENEHFCIGLARSLGMPVASSAIQYFAGTAVIVVERYDRVRNGAKVTRIHQEDMCQALARMPHLKYQNQGGPSPREIISLIREHSSNRETDEARFMDALIFNWLISGTDAHAKNYSFLIAPHGQVRLSPLYDLSSALPYPKQIPPRKATLGMKIGGQYKVQAIGKRDWEKFATESRIDFEALRTRILQLSEAMPVAADKVGVEMQSQGVMHDVVERLIEGLADRVLHCRAAFTKTGVR